MQSNFPLQSHGIEAKVRILHLLPSKQIKMVGWTTVLQFRLQRWHHVFKCPTMQEAAHMEYTVTLERKVEHANPDAQAFLARRISLPSPLGVRSDTVQNSNISLYYSIPLHVPHPWLRGTQAEGNAYPVHSWRASVTEPYLSWSLGVVQWVSVVVTMLKILAF